MADLIAEVDEALKQERLEKLWKKYKPLVLTFITVTILGTAAWSGYKAWNNGVNEAQTDKYIAAMEQAENKDLPPSDFAKSLLELSTDLRPGLRNMARWNAAAKFLDSSDADKAIEIYLEIEKDSSAPREFRLLASYQRARLSVKDDPEAGLKLLNAIARNETHPWSSNARLDMAVVQADYLREYTKARDHIAVLLGDKNLPSSLDRKARALDILYMLLEERQKSAVEKGDKVSSKDDQKH